MGIVQIIRLWNGIDFSETLYIYIYIYIYIYVKIA